MDVISDREQLLRMANYPGMIPNESRVLRQFIARYGSRFDEWRFNVRIGEGVELGDDFEPKLRETWARWTKARPDTVAFKHPADACIVEVKWDWTNEAVWQLQAYRDLYVKAFPEHTVRLVGCATYATPTARTLASSAGVQLYLYSLPLDAPDVAERVEEDGPDGL